MKKIFTFKNILIFLGFLFMIGAFLSVLGPGFVREYYGYSYDVNDFGTYIARKESVYLFGLLFGKYLKVTLNLTSDFNDPSNIAELKYGPVSYLGLISFIILAASIVAFIIFTIWDKPLIRLCLTSALFISGILMFFVLEVGTYYITYNYVYTFREFFGLDDYSLGVPVLGAGVYCFSAFTFLSAICFMIEGSIGVYKKRKLKIQAANGELEEPTLEEVKEEKASENTLETPTESTSENVNEQVNNEATETNSLETKEKKVKEKKVKEEKPKKVKKRKNKDEVDFNL